MGGIVEGVLEVLQAHLASYCQQAAALPRMARYGLTLKAPQPKEIQALDVLSIAPGGFPAVRVVLDSTDPQALTWGVAEATHGLTLRLYYLNSQKLTPQPGARLVNTDQATATMFLAEAFAWAVCQTLLEVLPGWKGVDGVPVGAWALSPPRVLYRGALQVDGLAGLLSQTDVVLTLRQDVLSRYGG